MVDVSIIIHLDDAKIEQVEQDPETFFLSGGKGKMQHAQWFFLKVLFVNVTRIWADLTTPVHIRIGCVVGKR